ncbi:BnaC05g14210D [Brassica napus]|uniref:BnaC05g14210D protein n=1 Tax=Brassica napus TaxID=3708 RepID=A0A078FXU4_BRANA|nr:BnaC05g14210D [Brassica napus]
MVALVRSLMRFITRTCLPSSRVVVSHRRIATLRSETRRFGYHRRKTKRRLRPITATAVRGVTRVQTELCFNCNACKAGVLANIREKWRHLLVFNICLLIFLITVYSCGCCARRNNQTARKSDSA